MNPSEDETVGELKSVQREMFASLEELEAEFRRDYPLVWLVTLAGPFVITAVLLALLFWLEPRFAWKLTGTAVATFFFFGRFIILQGKHVGLFDVGPPPDSISNEMSHDWLPNAEQLFAMVTYMDIAVASLLVFHLGVVFRLPAIGPKIGSLVLDGRFILEKQRWMRRLTFAGLVLFVTFPLAASGSIGGSLFGRLLGMSRFATFVGVIVGSLIGNGIMYLGAKPIGSFYERYPAAQWAGLALIGVVIFYLERRYRKMKQRFLDDLNRKPSKGSDA